MRFAISFFVSLAIVPSAQAMSSSTPREMEQINFTTYLRAGPGTNYRPTDEAQTGQVVQVGSCAEGWCKIFYDGASGYVAQNTLEALPAGSLAKTLHCSKNQQTGYHGSDGVVLCASPPAPTR